MFFGAESLFLGWDFVMMYDLIGAREKHGKGLPWEWDREWILGSAPALLEAVAHEACLPDPKGRVE